MPTNVTMASILGNGSSVPARERVQFCMLPTCTHHKARSLRAEAKTKPSAAGKAVETAADKVAKGADKAKEEIKEKTRLGASGLEVDKLCIGAWSWNDRSGYWGQNSHGNYTEADLREAFKALIDNELTFIDTAEVYGFGKSEEFIGDQAKITGTEPVIATKFAPLPYRFSSNNVIKALKGSLIRLRRDQVDLYQIHWPGFPVVNNWATNSFVKGLARAQIARLTKAVGVSNFKAERVREANKILLDQGVALASNQVQYSLLYRRPESNGVIQACRDTNTALMAYSPLCQGLLSGKYTLQNKPGGPRSSTFSDERIVRIQPLLELLRDIGTAHRKTAAQVAVNWVISKGEQEGFTAIPILGVKTRRQAEEARGVLGWRLSREEIADLDRVSSVFQNDRLGAPFEQW